MYDEYMILADSNIIFIFVLRNLIDGSLKSNVMWLADVSLNIY